VVGGGVGGGCGWVAAASGAVAPAVAGLPAGAALAVAFLRRSRATAAAFLRRADAVLAHAARSRQPCRSPADDAVPARSARGRAIRRPIRRMPHRTRSMGCGKNGRTDPQGRSYDEAWRPRLDHHPPTAGDEGGAALWREA